MTSSPTSATSGSTPTVGRSWLQYMDGAMDENFGKWGNSRGKRLRMGGLLEQRARLAQVRPGARQGLPRGHALGRRRCRRGALRLGHDAPGRGRACSVRAAQQLHLRDVVPRVRLRDRRAGRAREPHLERRPPAPVQQRDRRGQPHIGQLSADLCGGTYSGSGHNHATNIQLGPNSAAILTLDSGSSAGTCTDQDSGGAQAAEAPAATRAPEAERPSSPARRA